MYKQYYNLTGRPFQLTPDPQFYFESATHRKAMSYLGYGLAQGEGFIVITGDIGAGKTTLVGHLMATIDPQRLTAVKIASTDADGENMLRLAAHAFGIATEGVEKAHVLSRIEAFMHHQARAGRRSLLIVDEAQNLSFEALESLRLLSNFQLGGQSLVQIFLLGQPEFRDSVSTPRLEQLRQRIIATHHLEPMQPDEVRPYIEHRLKVVAWAGNPAFTDEAFALLAEASGCVPRRLNALAQHVLVRGAEQELQTLDADLVQRVCTELGELGPARVVAPRPAPEAEETPPVVAAPEKLGEERQAIRAEVRSLRAAIGQVVADPAPEEQPAPVMPAVAGLSERERIDGLESRLVQIEARLEEQDEMLRRILAKLIEWMEQDGTTEAVAERAA